MQTLFFFLFLLLIYLRPLPWRSMFDRNFFRLLEARQAAGFHLCVGLDTSPATLPPNVKSMNTARDAWYSFNNKVIDATVPFAAAFKPNIAFYEAMGRMGMEVLRLTTYHIRRNYPHIPVIIDAGRADIGTSYIHALLNSDGDFDFDAVTVHAWYGMEAMRPFLERWNKGIIVVVRTSNIGANEFQRAMTDLTSEEYSLFPQRLQGSLRRTYQFPSGSSDNAKWSRNQLSSVYACPAYQRMALRIAHYWNKVGDNCAVVADATYPSDVAAIRAIIGEKMQILSPGFGKQAADVRAAVRALRNGHGTAFIVNSSSGITDASQGPDFAEVGAAEAQKLHNLFTQYRLEV